MSVNPRVLIERRLRVVKAAKISIASKAGMAFCIHLLTLEPGVCLALGSAL